MSMLAEPRRKQRIGPNPRGKFFIDDQDNRGRQMLAKMGWKTGDGLGLQSQGMAEPIKPKIQMDASGLGYDKKTDPWIAHNEEFEALLKNLQANSGDDGTTKAQAEAQGDEESCNGLEKKSKGSRSRIHYHKFVKNKDLSGASTKDMSCIFGKSLGNKNSVALPTLIADYESIEDFPGDKCGTPDVEAPVIDESETMCPADSKKERKKKKKKRKEKDNDNDNPEEEHQQHQSPSPPENIIVEAETPQDVSIDPELPEDRKRKKKKKHKKRNAEELEEPDAPISNELTEECPINETVHQELEVEGTHKKKKSKKRKHRETEEVAENPTVEQEETAGHEHDCHQDKFSNEVTEALVSNTDAIAQHEGESEVSHKKKKSKKRMHKSEEEVVETNSVDQEVVAQENDTEEAPPKKKKRKHKHKNSDDQPTDQVQCTSNNEEWRPKLNAGVDKGKVETFGSLTFINRGSIDDYFKSKRLLMLNRTAAK